MAEISGILGATILLSFSFSFLLLGLFGSYFGKGKSRSLGLLISLTAILLMGVFSALTWQIIPGLTPIFDSEAVGRSFLSVFAATAGTILAVAAFLGLVTRS